MTSITCIHHRTTVYTMFIYTYIHMDTSTHTPQVCFYQYWCGHYIDYIYIYTYRCCSKLIKIKQDLIFYRLLLFLPVISHLVVPGLIHANTECALGGSGYKYSEHTTFQNTDASFFILMETPSNVPCIKHEHPILHLGSICLNRSAITNTIMLVKVICLLVFNSSSTGKSVTSTGMQMAVGEAAPAWKTLSRTQEPMRTLTSRLLH